MKPRDTNHTGPGQDAGATPAPDPEQTAAPGKPWPPDILRAIAMPPADWERLRALPWGIPLQEWPAHGVATLTIRRGESRHPVLFLEAGRRRYAIKETSPEAAAHEIAVFEEVQRRGLRALEPVGSVVVRGEPVPAGEIAGQTVYTSGDVGYCITRLAEHVLPQSILYRYPFTDANKRLLWSAVAQLLVDLHEAGIFWGDPSLANVLMDLSGHRLTAVMADAETAEVHSQSLGEGLRRQDLDSFVESLEWQAEDIRLARGLTEEQRLVTEGDSAYFLARYAGLRAEHTAGRADGDIFARLRAVESRMRRLDALGYGLLHLGARAVRAGMAGVESAVALPSPTIGWRAAILRPGWYAQRLRVLLGVRVPRAYARRIYQHILIHKWLLSERAGHDVGIDGAARDWHARYQQPALAFVAAYLPDADESLRYDTFLAILDHTWRMSQREERAVPIEEGAVDYALSQTLPALPAD